MQQQFFNSTSTQFVSGGGGGGLIAVQRGTFRNDSAVAMAIGIPRLKEETSTNLSAGVVLQPTDELTVTADYYNIKIDDRIVISGAIGMGLDAALDAALASANADAAQFFLNAADTTTTGVDLVVDWGRALDSGGDLGVSFAANFTDTDIDRVVPPSALSTIPGIQDLVFTSQDRSILTEWQPKSRMNLTTDYARNNWFFKLAFNRYGSYTVEEGNGDRQKFGDKILVDTQFSFETDGGLTFKIGGNNIFDQMPDRNLIGQSRAGTIVDGNGDTVVDTPGVFTYSRRSAPFGFNGAYWYAGFDYKY